MLEEPFQPFKYVFIFLLLLSEFVMPDEWKWKKEDPEKTPFNKAFSIYVH